jgi:hypothetical protein
MKRWSLNDIETLKHNFLRGVAIKITARSMGCSPSAVNKALTRFNIRPKIFSRCWAHKKPLYETSHLNHSPIHKDEPETMNDNRCLAHLTVHTSQEKKPNLLMKGQKASPQQLLDFLKEHDYHIQPRINRATWSVEFVMGNEVLNVKQLLLVANKIRCNEGLEIFIL